MLPESLVIVAILLRLVSGASYLRATWHGKARPNLVSWVFWSVTAMIAFTTQLIKGAGPEAWVTLAIGLSPIAVCVAALYRRTYAASFGMSDKWCIVLTSIGIVAWVISKDPLTALLLSIVADILSNIPTLLKSYRAPHTEHTRAYVLSAISMGVVLLTISDWRLSAWLFPAYILAINLLIIVTITILSKVPRTDMLWNWRQPHRLAYEEIEIDTTRHSQ